MSAVLRGQALAAKQLVIQFHMLFLGSKVSGFILIVTNKTVFFDSLFRNEKLVALFRTT